MWFCLGFLSTEDEVLPGNLGLKDQSIALRWIHENIESFGGDCNKITLAGFSAGSSSVQYHYLSPWSKGLFHSGIMISGTSFNPWGFALQPAEKAKKLGSIFDCPTNSSRSLVNCLRKIPAHTLTGATKEFQVIIYNLLTHSVFFIYSNIVKQLLRHCKIKFKIHCHENNASICKPGHDYDNHLFSL